MNKSDFQKAIELSPSTVAKLGKNETVNMDVLARICDYFQCGIDDIVSYDPKKTEDKYEEKQRGLYGY